MPEDLADANCRRSRIQKLIAARWGEEESQEVTHAKVVRVGDSDTHGALIYIKQSRQVFHCLARLFTPLGNAREQSSIVVADVMETREFEELTHGYEHEVCGW